MATKPLFLQAVSIVQSAERDIGRKLDDAQRRDLLCDNTDWNRERITLYVAQMRDAEV